MTRPGCKHAFSEKQIRFFGAVAGDKSTKKTTMTPAEAKHHIREAGKEGWNIGRALGKVIQGKRKRGKK